jgi:inner membrane protein
MTGRTHDAAALTALIGAAIIYPPTSLTLATALVALLANQIGGIAPDIDQPTAPFWRNLPLIGHIFGGFTDKLLGGHRFLTHSLIGVAALAWLAHWLLVFLSPVMHHIDITIVWYAFVIGLVSHLVMDTFTKEGVPWLLPIPIKFGFLPIKDLRITTGKFVETLIIFPGLLLLDVYLLSQHYHAIHTFVHSRLGS